MKKIIILTLALTFCLTSLFANEVNVFSARHYDSDIQLYEVYVKNDKNMKQTIKDLGMVDESYTRLKKIIRKFEIGK